MRTTSPTPLPADVDLDDLSRLRMVLLRLARRLRQQAHTGITPSQMSALASIERQGPLPLGELAAVENVQPPTISRIVASLEEEGYVQRTVDPSDRRLALVATTAKARRELQRIRRERNQWLAAQLRHLDDDERRHVVAALPALERLVDMEDPS